MISQHLRIIGEVMKVCSKHCSSIRVAALNCHAKHHLNNWMARSELKLRKNGFLDEDALDLRKALQVHWASDSDKATKGLWIDMDEECGDGSKTPPEDAAMRIWPAVRLPPLLPSAEAAAMTTPPSVMVGTWHVIVLTIVWMWWSRPVMLACNCRVSRIQRRSQVPSQVFWQVHSQGLPWIDSPPAKIRGFCLLLSRNLSARAAWLAKFYAVGSAVRAT